MKPPQHHSLEAKNNMTAQLNTQWLNVNNNLKGRQNRLVYYQNSRFCKLYGFQFMTNRCKNGIKTQEQIIKKVRKRILMRQKNNEIFTIIDEDIQN